MADVDVRSRQVHADKVREVLDRLAQAERDYVTNSVAAVGQPHTVFMAPTPSRSEGHVLVGRHQNILTQSYGL